MAPTGVVVAVLEYRANLLLFARGKTGFRPASGESRGIQSSDQLSEVGGRKEVVVGPAGDGWGWLAGMAGGDGWGKVGDGRGW